MPYRVTSRKMSSWKRFQQYSRLDKKQVLSRHSKRCILPFRFLVRIGMGLLKKSKGDKPSHRKDILSVTSGSSQHHGRDSVSDEGWSFDEDVMSRAYKHILDWCAFTHILSEIPSFLIAGARNNKVHTSVLKHSAVKLINSESWQSVMMSESWCHGTICSAS